MWAFPPRQLLLEKGGLHIWRASLSLPATVRERLEGVLSASEQQRCRRFTRPEDRARCAAARAALRIVLSKYLTPDPRGLSITAGPSGKPSLKGSTGADGIQFNMSHAGNLALIAVSRGMRVGIDIERIREVRNMESILRDFFSEQEQDYLRSRRGKERIRAFFLLWTRREAAAKAAGIGLFDSFVRFTLSPRDRASSGFGVALPQPGARAGRTESWWIRDLTPAPRHAGAVCVEGQNIEPTFWRLHDWWGVET